jgi:hypothetical protein
MNVVDIITGPIRTGLAFFTRPVLYQAQGAIAPSTINAFMRGLRTQDTFAAAAQMDLVAVVNADQFRTVVGNQTPRRYDRLIADGQSYAVEEWRASPAAPPPIEFKILLRGSQQ